MGGGHCLKDVGSIVQRKPSHGFIFFYMGVLENMVDSGMVKIFFKLTDVVCFSKIHQADLDMKEKKIIINWLPKRDNAYWRRLLTFKYLLHFLHSGLGMAENMAGFDSHYLFDLSLTPRRIPFYGDQKVLQELDWGLEPTSSSYDFVIG